MILAIIGYAFILLGVVQLGRDIFVSMQARGLIMETLGQFWYGLNAGSLNLAQAVTERYLWPPLWDPGMVFFLQAPVWLLLFVVAFFCLAISQSEA